MGGLGLAWILSCRATAAPARPAHRFLARPQTGSPATASWCSRRSRPAEVPRVAAARRPGARAGRRPPAAARGGGAAGGAVGGGAAGRRPPAAARRREAPRQRRRWREGVRGRCRCGVGDRSGLVVGSQLHRRSRRRRAAPAGGRPRAVPARGRRPERAGCWQPAAPAEPGRRAAGGGGGGASGGGASGGGGACGAGSPLIPGASSGASSPAVVAGRTLRGVGPDSGPPHTGHAPRPWVASTRSATAICCSLVASCGRGGELRYRRARPRYRRRTARRRNSRCRC